MNYPFGEIIIPSSRAFWVGEDDGDLPESEEKKCVP